MTPPPPSKPAMRPMPIRAKPRVLVIDDSSFFRQSITEMLSSSGQFEVVGRAGDGVEAMALMRTHMPDLVTLDLEMPRMNGFSFLRWVMAAQPVPVLVISSHDSHASVFHALELGAADFMPKPTRNASLEILSIKQQLYEKLHQISAIGLKAVVQRSHLLAQPPAVRYEKVRRPAKSAAAYISPVRLVVIGASTGGPRAVQAVLRELPPTFPAPILVVQHMPPVFTTHFAERLNTQCPLTVKEAEDGELIEPGKILVVPGDFHLTVRRSGAIARVSLTPRQAEDRYAPSVDLTMQSAAELFTTGVLGIVLTGMGDDGKEGMLAIKRKGGRTIAESEETAAIFGMPREALLAGAVDQLLPLPAIGPALVKQAMTE